MSLVKYRKELEKILPAGCARCLDQLEKYEKPSEYLFNAQGGMKFLEELLQVRFKDKNFSFGFKYGLFSVNHYPKGYLLLALADTILKESIVTGILREIDGAKVETLVLTDNLLLDYRERGNYIEAYNRANNLLEKVGRGVGFIVYQPMLC